MHFLQMWLHQSVAFQPCWCQIWTPCMVLLQLALRLMLTSLKHFAGKLSKSTSMNKLELGGTPCLVRCIACSNMLQMSFESARCQSALPLKKHPRQTTKTSEDFACSTAAGHRGSTISRMSLTGWWISQIQNPRYIRSKTCFKAKKTFAAKRGSGSFENSWNLWSSE